MTQLNYALSVCALTGTVSKRRSTLPISDIAVRKSVELLPKCPLRAVSNYA
ncbi:hypothetical protein SCLCIDRAFT_30251 [Scleroderma citrinum Foug A]|uniref:Uncharacterized protein n=1 Tax=Scleroderma citrinum Foug A TaxID=1036808 RepID=A0A0C3DHK1_9AGAM|nr:hypothetical protein SCLCIDRAFT_30251 [Scleroderma citrinum Foug A]